MGKSSDEWVLTEFHQDGPRSSWAGHPTEACIREKGIWWVKCWQTRYYSFDLKSILHYTQEFCWNYIRFHFSSSHPLKSAPKTNSAHEHTEGPGTALPTDAKVRAQAPHMPHECRAQSSTAQHSTLLSGHTVFRPLGAGEESSHCCPRAWPRLGAIKLYKMPDGF